MKSVAALTSHTLTLSNDTDLFRVYFPDNHQTKNQFSHQKNPVELTLNLDYCFNL